MTSEHLPTAAELIGDPDKYRAIFTEELRTATRTAHEAKIMLRKIDILTREADEIEVYRSNGLPEPSPTPGGRPPMRGRRRRADHT